MPTLRTLAVLTLCLLSGAAGAQESDGMAPEGMSGSSVTSSLKGLHGITASTLLATAQQLDEAMYGYRPADDVRTAGQILAHVANAQYAFCSSAAGADSPNATDFEATLSAKADIVAALAYCEGVYDAMTDAQGAETRSFFGTPMAGSAILAFNSAHNYEHYGNLVTYMRINGIVPPSSQPPPSQD